MVLIYYIGWKFRIFYMGVEIIINRVVEWFIIWFIVNSVELSFVLRVIERVFVICDFFWYIYYLDVFKWELIEKK